LVIEISLYYDAQSEKHQIYVLNSYVLLRCSEFFCVHLRSELVGNTCSISSYLK